MWIRIFHNRGKILSRNLGENWKGIYPSGICGVGSGIGGVFVDKNELHPMNYTWDMSVPEK